MICHNSVIIQSLSIDKLLNGELIEFLVLLDSFVTGIANSTSTSIRVENWGMVGWHEVEGKPPSKLKTAKWYHSMPFLVPQLIPWPTSPPSHVAIDTHSEEMEPLKTT